MRVLALGSCRVHDPLRVVQPRSAIEYFNRRSWKWPPIFIHDIHEAIQLVRLGRGEITMPKEIRPFAYEGGLAWRYCPAPLKADPD